MNFPKIIYLLAAGSALAAPGTEPKPLDIGAPAPPLQAAKWLQGEPITAFAKDRVTVIHFWATWFAPSTELGEGHEEGEDSSAMQRLAKKYQGKVTFLSINVEGWDHRGASEPAEAKPEPEAALLTRAAKFVEDSGDQIWAPVAADGAAAFMAKNWLQAAGELFPGAVFIIDRTGKIVWIGSPDTRPHMDCLPTLQGRYYDADELSCLVRLERIQEIVDALLAGTLDIKVLADRRARSKRVTALEAEITQKIRASQADEALRDLERAFAQEPALKSPLALYHVALLLGSDERKGYSRIRELLAGPLKDDVAALRLILQELLHDDHRPAPDRTLTIAVAQRITELVKAQEREAARRGQVSAFAWRDLALAHFKNGDATRSVEAQKHALELAEKHLGKDEKLLQTFREELAQYEAKKKGK
jgi:thiol-disulfide isomerase/thioredoxin